MHGHNWCFSCMQATLCSLILHSPITFTAGLNFHLPKTMHLESYIRTVARSKVFSPLTSPTPERKVWPVDCYTKDTRSVLGYTYVTFSLWHQSPDQQVWNTTNCIYNNAPAPTQAPAVHGHQQCTGPSNAYTPNALVNCYSTRRSRLGGGTVYSMPTR